MTKVMLKAMLHHSAGKGKPMTASNQDHNPENTPATETVNPNRVSCVAKGLYILLRHHCHQLDTAGCGFICHSHHGVGWFLFFCLGRLAKSCITQ